MIRQSAVLFLRSLGDLFAGLVVIAMLLVWRLAAGPLMLDSLGPEIEAALAPGGDEIAIETGTPELRLDREAKVLELALPNVRARADGETVVALPTATLTLSATALLQHGVLAPERIVARAPALALIRRADGSIGLRGTRGEGEELDLGAIARLLSGPAEGDRPLDHLEVVEITGARVRLEDEVSGYALQADEGSLVLARAPEGLEATLSLDVDQGDHVLQVDARASLDSAREQIDYRVLLDNLRPADLARFAPDLPLDPAGIDLALDLRLSGEATFGGESGPIEVHLVSEGGRLRAPGVLENELPIDSLEFVGEVAADLGGVVIEELTFATGDTRARASGEVTWREGLAIRAEAEAENLRADELATLWPQVAAPQARDWVVPNVTDGIVPRAEVAIDIRPGDLDAKPLPDAALDGSFAFEGLTVHYFRPLPPITGASGRVTFTGQSMNFAVAGGGIGDLRIEDGNVAITGIGIEGREATQLEAVAEIVGPVDQALTLINREPLGFAAELGIDPSAATGSTRTELRIGLPLHRDVDEEEVWVDAQATLSDVQIAGLLDAVDVENGDFELAVTTERMQLEGEAEVLGAPLEVTWEEFFADDSEVDRRLRIAGRLEPAALTEFGIELPVPAQGAFAVDARATESDGVRRVDLTVDLTPLAFGLPELDWQKAAGEPGSLTASLIQREGAPVQVDRFALEAEGLEATGWLELAGDTLEPTFVDLERFEVGEQQGALQVQPGEDGGWQARLRAERLDLTWLLEDAGGLGADAAPGPPLELDVTADRVVFGGRALTEVTALLRRDASGWRTVEIGAKLPEGGNLAFTLEPENGTQRLRLTTGDAGDLLQTFDQSRRIDGGALTLSGTVHQQLPTLRAEGTLAVRDFTLFDAPLLARLLTLASLTGIGDVLGGEGLSVRRFDAPFVLEDGVLTLDEGRLAGSQVGLTFEGTIDLEQDELDLSGTVVPIYTLNRIIGQIPIIGEFFTGSEGEGAFAATFSVSGPTDEPEIQVNPLSILTPGFVRELFTGIVEGTHAPPEILNQDR